MADLENEKGWFQFIVALARRKIFVALISFYELRISHITALNTMGAARLQREAAHAAAFLSRLANLHNREILVMRGYKIYKRLNRVTPSRSFVRSQCVVDGLQKIHSERGCGRVRSK